jgi:quercetin dioxygenase-like cupin family protein
LRESILTFDPSPEFYTPEDCYVLELSNSAEDPAASIARARVVPVATTRWHRVRGTVKRYIILEGKGRVEVGSLPLPEVNPGDVVLIPPDCR